MCDAYHEHVGHLNEAGDAFLRARIGHPDERLEIRKKAQRDKDMRLMKAKDKLTVFLNAMEALDYDVPEDYLIHQLLK
jgi:hypothetical protein